MAFDLNHQIAERVAETTTRLKTAEDELSRVEAQVVSNQNAIDAADDDARPALEVTKKKLLEDQQRAVSIVAFYAKQLNGLLNRSRLSNVNWPSLFQYLVFTGLAITVLLSLLGGVNGPIPYGTSPRGMITFLIAVITVGIAIILVLATIVSDSVDREKRFNQGKEIFTALIGVLGTIVGYYFGTTLDDKSALRFEPIAVAREVGKPTTISTRVVGGKGPYDYSIIFTSAQIPTIKGTSKDGRITETVDAAAARSGELTFDLRVDDAAGATTAAEYKLGQPTSTPAASPTGSPKASATSDQSGPGVGNESTLPPLVPPGDSSSSSSLRSSSSSGISSNSGNSGSTSGISSSSGDSGEPDREPKALAPTKPKATATAIGTGIEDL